LHEKCANLIVFVFWDILPVDGDVLVPRNKEKDNNLEKILSHIFQSLHLGTFLEGEEKRGHRMYKVFEYYC